MGVVGQLLPIALAIALSTVPLTAVLTILLSPRPAVALPFLIGLLLGMLIVTGAFALGLRAAPLAAGSAQQAALAIGEIVLGSALVVYGIVLFARRRKVPPIEDLPRWLKAVGRIRAAPAFGLGLILTVRPKALLLSAAAGIVIGSASFSPTEFVVVLLLFVVVGGSTVAVPVIFTLARPKEARRPLGAAERWIAENSRTMTTLIAVIVGVVVLGVGLTNL